MCKLPVAGRVKTRLTPPLSPQQAADVQAVFLKHLADRWPGAVFCHDPSTAGEAMRHLLGEVTLVPQSDGDLGDRLVDVAERFAGEHVAFYGADVPDAPEVEHDADKITLGPTGDGGFWTMGVPAGVNLRPIFAGVAWSSGREMAQVVANAESAGHRVRLLRSWHDVDDADGLARLFGRLPEGKLSGDLAFVRAVLKMPVP